MELKRNLKKSICILLTFVCCLFLISCNRDAYKTVACPYQLKQISMCDEKAGWGLTLENEILFTENGIENFKPVRDIENIDSYSDRLANAAFINAQTAYVTYFSSEQEHLIVEYTRDGGASWRQTLIKYDDDAGNALISFANDTEGYLLYCSTPALGQMKKHLFYTNDAGASFTFISDLTSTIAGYPQGITAVSKEQVSIAVTYHGADTYLYQTSDGTQTWESIEIFPRTDNIRYVDGYAPVFYDNNKQKGAIILKTVTEDAAYELFTTTDAGSSWTTDGRIPCDTLLSYSVTDHGQLYIVDQDGSLFLFH